MLLIWTCLNTLSFGRVNLNYTWYNSVCWVGVARFVPHRTLKQEVASSIPKLANILEGFMIVIADRCIGYLDITEKTLKRRKTPYNQSTILYTCRYCVGVCTPQSFRIS